jgi:hypothetical protein
MIRTGTTDKSTTDNKGMTCSVVSCTKEAKTNGFCYRHNFKFKKYDDPNKGEDYLKNKNIKCLIDSCNNSSKIKLLCRKHYENFCYHKKKSRFENVGEYIKFLTVEKRIEEEYELQKLSNKRSGKLKAIFVEQEEINLKSAHYGGLKFQVFKDDKKIIQCYRVIVSSGLNYCNNQIALLDVSKTDIFEIRIYSRSDKSTRNWREIAYLERTKSTQFNH